MNTAKIYYCESYDFEDEKYLHLLPEDRLEKYNRLKQPVDKKNCLGAFVLLKSALKKEGIDSFSLKLNEMGKPYLEKGEIYFNISHCKSGFACGISQAEIGVDIESISKIKPAMMKKAFSEAERKIIACDELNFTRLWTLKESIIKRYGEGIGSYKKYEFSKIGDDFYAFQNRFVSINTDSFVLTSCGNFDKIEFIKTQTVELD